MLKSGRDKVRSGPERIQKICIVSKTSSFMSTYVHWEIDRARVSTTMHSGQNGIIDELEPHIEQWARTSYPTDIPVYFFGLCLFLSPNGLLHCPQIFVTNLFLKMPICYDVNRNTDITFDCLFLCFVNNHWCPSFCWALTAIKISIFENNLGTIICGQWIKPFGDRNK